MAWKETVFLMCGIAGKIYQDSQRKVPREDVARMTGVLAHRGPDGEGVWVERNVGLGHRRLSIIDLRAVAAQPMSNEDGAVWITFNGEIYNFQELRKDLESRGHVFRTESDTEAIIHAYEEYGRECLHHLRGMFAFAIWDSRQRVLFVARDRVGKKPVFYFVDGERFLFGSEIKALLADLERPNQLNPIALDHYLAFGYIPAPLTAFQGIKKLPAAHWLEWKEGQVTTGRYWKLRYRPKRQINIQDAVQELRWRLSEAVRVRLMSDVPIGAFLSGGIDSSAVVASMAQSLSRPVRTFCVGFDDKALDERPFARMVADRFGTEHTELLVSAPVAEILPRLIWHYDEPFGDSSAVPSYAIAQLTRQHVTVVLNGDGGDENFGGYDRYLAMRRSRWGDGVPRWLWRGAGIAVSRLPERLRHQSLFAKMARVTSALARSPGRRYATWSGHTSEEFRHFCYSSDFSELLKNSDPEALVEELFSQSDKEDMVEAALETDVNLYLADDLLVKMDRASMAHSLEARSPFLDHPLMEFAATLPTEMKVHSKTKKKVLKDALQGIIPEMILDRPKMGFGAPLASWFRGPLRVMMQDVLLDSRSLQRGVFQPAAIQRCVTEHLSGNYDHSTMLWDLLVLELWHRTFLDENGRGIPGAADSPGAVR